MPIHDARGRKTSRGFADFALIAMALRGGATSKIGEARLGKCGLTITPPDFSKVPKEKNFKKKKYLAGEDLLDPLVQV